MLTVLCNIMPLWETIQCVNFKTWPQNCLTCLSLQGGGICSTLLKVYSLTNKQHMKKVNYVDFQTQVYKVTTFHFPSLLGYSLLEHRYQAMKKPRLPLRKAANSQHQCASHVSESYWNWMVSHIQAIPAGTTFCRDKLTLTGTAHISDL